MWGNETKNSVVGKVNILIQYFVIDLDYYIIGTRREVMGVLLG